MAMKTAPPCLPAACSLLLSGLGGKESLLLLTRPACLPASPAPTPNPHPNPPLPQGEEVSVPTSMPSGVEDILSELSKEPGVAGVALGRRAEERRTVSQDLELWISKEAVVGGYNLLARAGRLVQEIHVESGLPPAEMKAAVQRVLRRLV